MKRLLRPLLLLATALLVAAVAWLVFPSPFVHGVVVGVLVGPALLVVGFAVLARRLKKRMAGGLAPPPLPTGSWDFAMDLEDLEGATAPSSRFKGQALILNFWATWCPPCVAELPSLVRLHQATADLGVNMACVSREPREVVGRFLEKRNLPAPFFRVAPSLRVRVAAAWGAHGGEGGPNLLQAALELGSR